MAKTFEQKMEELTKGPNPTTRQVVEKLEKGKEKPKRGVDNETLVNKVARKLLELYYRPKKKFKPSGKRSSQK